MAFPSIIPGADLTIGPVQLFVFMVGIAFLAFGVDAFRAVTKADELIDFFHHWRFSYGFWLAGPILYYLTFHLFPVQDDNVAKILLLKWASVILTLFGVFS